MTLIVGYIYKDTAHLIADSAETVTFPNIGRFFDPSMYQSSFIETMDYDKNRIVIETAQKIYTIGDKLLAAYAGYSYGFKIIEDISIGYKSYSSIAEFLNSYFAGCATSGVQVIIAFHENRKPYLFYYYGKGDYKLVDPDAHLTFVYAGQNINTQTEQFLGGAYVGGYNIDDTLAGMIMAYQNSSLFQRSFSSGVGGYVNGAYASKNGITWAKDTMYILYSAHNFDKGSKYTIFKFNRANATFIISQSKSKVFVADIDRHMTDAIIQRWKKEVNNYASHANITYYGLKSYDTPAVIIWNRYYDDLIQFKDRNVIATPDIRKLMFRTYEFKNDIATFYIENNFRKGGSNKS